MGWFWHKIVAMIELPFHSNKMRTSSPENVKKIRPVSTKLNKAKNIKHSENIHRELRNMYSPLSKDGSEMFAVDVASC